MKEGRVCVVNLKDKEKKNLALDKDIEEKEQELSKLKSEIKSRQKLLESLGGGVSLSLSKCRKILMKR